MLPALLLFALLSKPLNATAIICPTPAAACSYIDAAPNVGSNTYFVEAMSSGNAYSDPSNVVTVTVKAGQKVTLNWTASSTPSVTHWVFRTSPPSGLLIITTH